MSTKEKLHQLKMNGYCVLEGIIPAYKIDEIRESAVAAQAAAPRKGRSRTRKDKSTGAPCGRSGGCESEGGHQRNPNLCPLLGG